MVPFLVLTAWSVLAMVVLRRSGWLFTERAD